MTGNQTRYQAMFDRLADANEGAFGAFVMLGDPDIATSEAVLDALVEGGADMLEVGIPFSDPVADGPTIQAAADRALAAGITPDDCFDILTRFRAKHPDIPVGILTYANLVLAPGRDAFYARCAAAGVDSVLVADVSSIEAPAWVESARRAGVDPVLIAAPNTPDHTLEKIAGLGSGYTYAVARVGVTGAERAMELDHSELFGALQRYNAAPPVLGFGISKPEHVRDALASGAAGVISGSAIVSLVQQGDLGAVRDFVKGMKAATAFPGR